MGIALQPDPALAQDDPTKPKKPPTANPVPTAGGGTLGLAPQPLAPNGAAAPAGTPSAAPVMTAPMTAPAPTVAPPSTPVNRIQLATDTFNNVAGQRQTQYEADSRDNLRTSAAMGQIGSGGLRTREGNLRLARERDLDALQKDLALKASEASVADASTAYQQALAGSQLGLSAELGRGGLEVQRGALDLDREQTGLTAALQRAGLTGLLDGQETLAAKQQKVQEAMANKSLSLEEGKLALAQLANTQQNTLQTAQLGLAQTGQAADIAARLQGLSLEQAKLELDRQVAAGQLSIAQANQALAAKEQAEGSAARSGQLALATTGQAADIAARLQGLSLEQAKLELDQQVQTGQLSVQQANQALAAKEQAEASGARSTQLGLAQQDMAFQQAQTAIENQFRAGQMTLAQRDQALRELQADTDLELRVREQDFSREAEQNRLALAKEQVVQQASQFGASQAQQLQLAQLADATNNRQIDVSTAHGKNTLLLELARIMGGPSGNVDPAFIRSLAAALGVPMETANVTSAPPAAPPTNTPPPPPPHDETAIIGMAVPPEFYP